jgi:hypothetical protein
MIPLGAIPFTLHSLHPAVHIETRDMNNTETNAHMTRSTQHILKREKKTQSQHHIEEKETYCDMTPESRNSPLLGNILLSTIL